MDVTVFKNFNEVIEQLPITAVLDQIRDGSYMAQVEGLRLIIESGNLKEYDKQKRCLPAFTPSATFEGGRKKKYLVQYSGLIILDIDKLSSEQLAQAFNAIIEIPFTYACFRSPSNNGLKVLVITDSSMENHVNTYNEVKTHYEQILNLPIDPSGKDITRLCFFSWDPDLFFNPEAKVFETISQGACPELDEGKTSNSLEFENIVQQIESAQIDITNAYKEWLTIGFALAVALGEDGRNFFHRISRINPQYDEAACNKQYDACLNSDNNGITAKSFFFIAKQHGLNISVRDLHNCQAEPVEASQQTAKENDKKKQRKNLFDVIEKFLLRSYTLRYNVVTSKIEIRKNNKHHFEPMTDYIENTIFRQLHKSNINVSMAKLRAILQSDFCTRFDPFQEYFDSLPAWDGHTDYIHHLTSTISSNADDLWHLCFKRWVVAMVASVLDPAIVNHTAIIFSGAQGIGKTTWMENLCPAELRPYMFSGTINPGNKDTLIHLSECMLINLDELENLNRTEIGTLKEIITKSAIRIRRSYGHHNESLVRRASFMGSVNTSQFLNDTTGSRRFLCFEVSNIKYDHNVDMSNVYSQAYALWKEGFRFYFDSDEISLISTNNEKYQIRTPEEELLLTWFQPVMLVDAPSFLTASQISVKLSEKSRLAVSTGNIISLGKALKKHKFIRTKKEGIYVWAVKELSFDQVDENSKKPSDDPPF